VCKNGLHKTRTIRVCVNLPFGPDTTEDIGEKEASVNGGTFKAMSGEDEDMLVTLDRTNIHLLLGKEKDMEDVYMLLKVATKCWDGWGS
jgi:hypothetical protein